MVSFTLVMTGCTSVSKEDAFKPVQANVTALSGQRVEWNQGTEADKKVEAEVQHLLATPLSANEAAQIALLNNPDLQATFEDIGISQADLVQAGLLKNPAFAGSWRFPNIPPGLGDIEYSVAEDFLSLAMMPIKTKIAATNLEATEDRVTHEVIHLIGEVKEQFYTYQAEVQLEDRLKLIIDSDQAAVDLAKSQHTSGNISDAALVSIETQLAPPKQALAESQKQKIMVREKLNRMMGLWGAEIEWTARPNLPEIPEHDPSLANLEELAVNQRRDLIAQRKEVDAIGQALALKTKTRYLPVQIYIGVDSERQTDGQRITGPILDTELPIFDQGQGDIAKLSAQHRHAQDELKALVIRIRSEVREERDTMKINREQALYYKKEVVPLNISAVNQTVLQYNAMMVNANDLFLTKQRELDTERDYLSAWRDYWITRSALEEAVGGSLRPVRSATAK